MPLRIVCISKSGRCGRTGRWYGTCRWRRCVVCYIQDLIVIPQVQAQGIGSQIIQKLKAYVESLREEESTMMLCLMCAKGREPFYEKHGFMQRPTDALGPGMIQYLTEK